MNRFLSLALLLCTLPFLSAGQTYGTCIQVVASSGKSAVRAGLHFTYTIGEPAIFTLKGSAYTVTQGFHQPDLCSTVSTHNLDLAAWGIEVFPNPTADLLTIRFDSERNNALNVSAFNLLGQAMLTDHPMTGPEGLTLDCSHWQPGIYLLQLRDPTTQATATVRVAKVD